MQFRSVFFLSLLCSPAVALKGNRLLSESLLSAKDTNEEKTNKLSGKKEEVSEEGVGKKGALSSKKGEAKGKKCKVDPTADLDGENDAESTQDEESRRLGFGHHLRRLNVTDEDDEYLLVCKPFKKGGGACKTLLEGEVPAVPSEDVEQLAGGSLTLEMHPKTDDAVEKMGRALKEVALATAGCVVPVRKLEATNVTNATESEVELDGMNMDGLEEVSNLCTNTDEEYQENCTQFGSLLTVYFSGDATDDHVSSMMNQFTGAVLDEATDGKYDEFADIYFIGATSSGVSSSASTRNNSEDGGANVGAIVGGVIGGLALVGAAVGGFLFYKRRQGGERVSPITAVDSQDGEGFLVLPNLFG
eukprot:CAMPEP_0194233584 /NCGR_PEP_ID=MMETSP0158-20130606/1523_1 /TAXON_ID=33649 /ORGANISM="Thalassionema nitzschioides, Strain L26-B" /LENGTH=359 /DNA_ID=CAMNT_0038966525 /DNA_START=54 /DNA_END=1133 /DNA_ORIENTATION=-